MRNLVALLLLSCVGCNSVNNDDKNSNAAVDTARGASEPLANKISIKPVPITKEELPAGLKFRGNMQEAWQWTDRLGENLLITAQVASYTDKKPKDIYDDVSTAEVHAFHFLKNGSDYKLRWKLSDAVKACEFDITCQFIKDAITITDLDSNGIGETVVQYLISCRSDVSPSAKKLIMHEDTVKYSLRGFMCDPGTPVICVTEKNLNLEKEPAAKEEWQEYTRLFGRYETEKEFNKAPPVFLIHARRQWLLHIKESFD